MHSYFSYTISHSSYVSYNFHLANWQGLNDYFCDVDFNTGFTTSDIYPVWESLHSLVMSVCDKFIPKSVSVIRKSPLPECFSPQVKHLLISKV